MRRIALVCLRGVSRLPFSYKAARRVVDFALNQNNCDSGSNGEMAFIARNAPSWKVVFDVGANVGSWTMRMSDLCPAADIYSFEPVASTFAALSSRVGDRARLFRIAFGESDGSKNIFVSDGDATLSSVHQRGVVGVTRPETIDVRTVDSFCEEHRIDRISFLKIDTEGNELNVLKGARSCIRAARVDVIQIEYGGTYIDARILLKDIFEFFHGTEYDLYKIYPERLSRISEYSQDLENFQYANFVAIRRSCGYR